MRNNNFFILFFLFFTPQFCFSQFISDTTQAGKLLNEGLMLGAQYKNEIAVIYYEKAKSLYLKDDKIDKYLFAKGYYLFGVNYKHLHGSNKELKDEYFQKLLLLKEEVERNHLESSYVMAKVYHDIGVYFFFSGDFNMSIKYHEKALGLFRKYDISFYLIKGSFEASCLVLISYNYLKLKDFEKARINILNAIKEFSLRVNNYSEVLGYLYSTLAFVYQETNKYEKALMYLEKSIKIRSNSLIPINFNEYENRGRLYSELGYFEKSIESFEIALKGKKKIFGNNHIQILKSYNRLGGIYQEVGKYNEALSYYKQALEGVIALRGSGNKGVASFYNNIGEVLHLQGKYKEALKNHRKALKIRLKTIGGEAPYTTNSYHNIGKALIELGQLDSASWYLHKGLNLRLKLDKLRPDMKKYVADSYNNVGVLALKIGDFNNANIHHKKALEINSKQYGEKHPLVAETYNYLGDIYFNTYELNLSLKNYHQAILANTVEFENQYVKDFPKIDDFIKPYPLLTSLISKAKVLKRLYVKSEGKNSDKLEHAFKIYKYCDQFLTQLRKGLSSEADKLEWMKNSRVVYEEGVEISFMLFEITQNEKYANQAFIFSEKSKASILSDKTAELSARLLSEIPDSLLQLEADIASEIASYNIRLQKEKLNEGSETKIKEYSDSLFQFQRKENKLISLFEKQYPNYYHLKFSSKEITIPNIQNTLNSKTTLVEYFQTISEVYVFAICKENYVIKKINVADKDLKIKLENFRHEIKNKKPAAFAKIAFELYSLLIAPIKNDLKTKKIILVPDGVLWYLNFDILLTEEVAHNSVQKYPYLIRDYVTSYSYSIGLLFQGGKDSKKDILKECLAFSYADKESAANGNLIAMRALRETPNADLPGTRKEISDISQIMNGKYYYGDYANERNFKKTAKDYAILHLALHGEVNEKQPLHSKLIFTQSAKDTVEDNLLHAYELYNMKLNAELAVLSACNTGTGKLEGSGEGVMSIGRAFMYAGCKSLLMSQWEVSDWATSGIMKGFYTYIDKGFAKDVALHKAKLDYLNKSDNLTGRPLMWAPLVLLGDNSPYKLKGNSSWYYYLVGAVLLIFVLVYAVKKSS